MWLFRQQCIMFCSYLCTFLFLNLLCIFFFTSFPKREDEVLIEQLCGSKGKTARIDAFNDAFEELEKGKVIATNWKVQS